MPNPVVYFDVTIADRPVGRIVMTLRADVIIDFFVFQHQPLLFFEIGGAKNCREFPMLVHW